MGTSEAVAVEREVLMRYRGQGWEIPVTLPRGDFDEIAAQELTTTFIKAYEAFFGRAIEGLAIEAVSWSVRVSSQRAAPELVGGSTRGPSPGLRRHPIRLRPGHGGHGRLRPVRAQ